MLGIEPDVCAAGLEDAEHADLQLRAPVDAQPHVRLRGHA